MQIITTHKNMDFDGLASLIAATLLYPGSIPVLPKTINPNVKAFLSIHKDFYKIYSADEIDLNKVSSLIVVDANSWERLDQMEKLSQRDDLEIILWDHHTNAGNITPTWKCQEQMGANITLMVRDIKKNRMVLTPMQATRLMVRHDIGRLPVVENGRIIGIITRSDAMLYFYHITSA